MSLKEAIKALRVLDAIFDTMKVKIPPPSASLTAALAVTPAKPKVEPLTPGMRVCLAYGCDVEFYGKRKDHRFCSHACCVRQGKRHGPTVRAKPYKKRTPKIDQ